MSSTVIAPPPAASGLRQESRRISSEVWILFIGFFLLGSFLRLAGLGAASTWIDEIHSLAMASGTLTREPQHMPLYFWILSLLVQVDDSEAWLRLPSAIFGIGVLPVLFMIGIEARRVGVGLTATALASISGFLVHYAQEIRMYSLVIFLGVLGTWAVVRLTSLPERKRARTGWAVLCIASVLNLYTSPFSAFIVAVHWSVVGLFTCRHPDFLKRTLILGSVVAALYARGILHMIPMADGSARVVQKESWHYDDLGFLFNHTIEHFAGLVGSLAIPLIIGSVAGSVVAWRTNKPLVLLAALAFFVPILTFYTVKPGHFYHPRYLTFAQPHLLLMVAFALVWLWDQLERWWTGARSLAPVGPTTIGVAVTLLATVASPDYEILGSRPDWRRAARVIHSEARSGDSIAVEPGYADNVLLYHLDQLATPGERIRLASGSSYSWYRMRREDQRSRRAERSRGPLLRIHGVESIPDLLDFVRGAPGRVWLVTQLDREQVMESGFEPVYDMPPTHSHESGRAGNGLAVYLKH